jgi:hypothetical protein
VPRCPRGLEHFWDWYTQIRQRVAGGMGVGLIPFGDFVHWENFTGHTLEPWEFVVLDAIDRQFVLHKCGDKESRVIRDE